MANSVLMKLVVRLLTNLKTVESAPLIPKKRRFSGPSLEPSWNQITANELPALPTERCVNLWRCIVNVPARLDPLLTLEALGDSLGLVPP